MGAPPSEGVEYVAPAEQPVSASVEIRIAVGITSVRLIALTLRAKESNRYPTFLTIRASVSLYLTHHHTTQLKGTNMSFIDDAKENLAEGFEKAKDALGDAAEVVEEKAGDAADFVKDKAEDVTEFVKDKFDGADAPAATPAAPAAEATPPAAS